MNVRSLVEIKHADASVLGVLPILSERYECRRWPYIATLPISILITLWVMMKKGIYKVCGIVGDPNKTTNHFLFDGLGEKLRLIKEGARSWKALDIIYNHRFGESQGVEGWLEDFWIGMMNAQSVRNRFKLIKMELKRALLTFAKEPEIRMMSLACGSAQAVIDVVAELKDAGIRVSVLLVDIDADALEHAKRLAQERGVLDRIQTEKLNVFKMERLARDFKPHLVEMLGLLDYLPKEKAVWLISRIRECLLPDGIFLTCNVHPNIEMYFLKWVINWSMIYRSRAELSSIIADSDFANFRLVYEPLNIHGIVIASKSY